MNWENRSENILAFRSLRMHTFTHGTSRIWYESATTFFAFLSMKSVCKRPGDATNRAREIIQVEFLKGTRRYVENWFWLTHSSRVSVSARYWNHYRFAHVEVMHLLSILQLLVILTAPCTPAFGKVVSLGYYFPQPAVEPRRIPIPKKSRAKSKHS